MENLNDKKFLAQYLKAKMQERIGSVTVEELEAFFNDNGWVLYDLDTMVADFTKWRMTVKG